MLPAVVADESVEFQFCQKRGNVRGTGSLCHQPLLNVPLLAGCFIHLCRKLNYVQPTQVGMNLLCPVV
jgi:hypothetical protein